MDSKSLPPGDAWRGSKLEPWASGNDTSESDLPMTSWCSRSGRGVRYSPASKNSRGALRAGGARAAIRLRRIWRMRASVTPAIAKKPTTAPAMRSRVILSKDSKAAADDARDSSWIRGGVARYGYIFCVIHSRVRAGELRALVQLFHLLVGMRGPLCIVKL